MTEPRLRWTGTEETNRFVDDDRGRVYWATERPLRVPADAYEEYLEQDGWEEVETEDDGRLPGRDAESVRDARAREAEQEDETETDINAGPATAETDAARENDRPTRPAGAATVEEDETADPEADPEAASGRSSESESERVTETASAADADFDAEEFITDNWRAVQRRIRSGEVDEHLDAIEAAERNRVGEPREASVLGAVEERRDETASGATDATDADSTEADAEDADADAEDADATDADE